LKHILLRLPSFVSDDLRDDILPHTELLPKKEVAYLMDIHLRLAATAIPTPVSELRLSLQYAFFMSISSCLIVAFWLFGPFNARRTLACILTFVEGFSEAFKVRLETINPAQVQRGGESLVH
jgi:hypothetical protein